MDSVPFARKGPAKIKNLSNFIANFCLTPNLDLPLNPDLFAIQNVEIDMSIAAAQISEEALSDMIQLFRNKPWTLNYHAELVELWNICTKREEQLLIKDLLVDFYIFNSDSELEALNKINEKIQNWGLSHSNTWIVAVADRGEVDGSTAGLQKLKNKVEPVDEWHSRFISNIPDSIAKIKTGDNVVLFDDFVGSGKKIVRKIDWLTRLLGAQNIEFNQLYCMSFSAMRLGVEHIKAIHGKDHFSPVQLIRGISDRYSGNELIDKIRIMKNIEGNLAEKYKNKKLVDFSFGYNQTESLYCAINDNCPNNVFPVFWWPLKRSREEFKTLFKRVG